MVNQLGSAIYELKKHQVSRFVDNSSLQLIALESASLVAVQFVCVAHQKGGGALRAPCTPMLDPPGMPWTIKDRNHETTDSEPEQTIKLILVWWANPF